MTTEASHAVRSKSPFRVLVVDDHPVFRCGLRNLLESFSEVEVCGEAESAGSALEVMRRERPDVALVDISLPGTDGIELIKLLLAEEPHLKILVISVYDEVLYALRALRAGAKGYVMKEKALETVHVAVRKILGGGIYVSPELADHLVFRAIHGGESDFGTPLDKLSDRELEVLRFFGRGASTRGVAEQLHLSVKTIETHRAHIKEKLGCKEAAELMKFAAEWVETTEGGSGAERVPAPAVASLQE